MAERTRHLIAPLYLFLCLILGGSAQGVWGNMVLQLIGIAIIAWAAVAPAEEPLVQPARQLLWIALLGLVIVALQLVPLPSSLWSHLGGRARIVDGYHVLGIAPPPLPVSLTPYKSLDTLLGIIPGLAIFCAIVRLKAYRGSFMAVALVGGAVAGILLGTLQVASAVPEESPWYLYAETNVGAAVGFFANANHMATLLLITLPFLAALAAAARGANIQRYSAFIALTAGTALVVMVGIALNGSLAAFGLVLPILLASVLIVVRVPRTLKAATMVLVVILLGAAIIALGRSAIDGSTLDQDATSSVQSRQQILQTTLTSAKEYFPWGSGLGSFRQVYAMHEDPSGITPTYVIHAHNDYAELILETGLAGILLLVLFLIWWGAAARRIWTSAEAGPFAKAASIASAAVLAHSLVDFPLRTAAVTAAFGVCLALLADRRSPQVADATDLRPTRHFVVR
jgi:O-antigen ligase